MHAGRRLTVCAALAAATAVLAGGLASPASADTPPLAAGPEAAAVTAAAAFAGVPLPQDDPFYTTPPGVDLAAAAPGSILRSRQVDASFYGIPLSVPENVYQLLIRTTNSVGVPVPTVTTVFVPKFPSYFGPRPLMSFQVAIDSLGTECNPSLEMRAGLEKEATGAFTSLAAGWDTVITDFEGTQSAQFAGPMAGHAVLDGIRAAKAFKAAGLSTQSRTVAWGYSGGGQATAWAAQLQRSYAPELSMAGYIAGDFAVNLNQLLSSLNKSLFSGFALGGMFGVARDYPQLQSKLNPAGQALQQRMANECQLDEVIQHPFQNIDDYVTSGNVLADPDAKAVLAANSLGSEGPYTTAPVAPVFLQQSNFDEVIPASQGQDIAKKWCSEGGQVYFDNNNIPEHVIGDLYDITPSLVWAEARFLGLPLTTNC